MLWGSSPAAVATRFTDVAQNFVADGPAERVERAKRTLLQAVAAREPATLNQVADATGRGAPADPGHPPPEFPIRHMSEPRARRAYLVDDRAAHR